MAGTLTATALNPNVALQTTNKDIVGYDLQTKYYSVVADGSNDATTKTITPGMKNIMFVTVSSMTSGKAVPTYAVSAGVITLTWASAVTSATYRVKIEGWG